MRSVATRQLVGAACGFLTLTGSQAAFAMDKYIDLEPPQTKSGLGYGYNSISREFVLRSCVQFAPGLVDGGGASGDDFKFSSIVSNSQLADEMDLSVATKFSASMGVASVNSSAKVDFKSVKTNFLTHTITSQKYHGILSGKTGEDPRTETFNKNPRGVLSSMKCTVDSDAGNDTPSIGCSAIALKSIQLDLVNTQDVAADAWKAPPVNNVVVIPKGVQSSVGYAAIVKKAVVAKSRKLVLPMNKQNVRCNAGLVSVEGQCVPKLKR